MVSIQSQRQAGGITNLAVTATKTLTLTSIDDFNLTAERTGFVIVRTATPNIVGDIAGNVRGASAVDLQLTRALATQVASGDYATIGGGSNNTASGSYATVVGGVGGVASGLFATVFGGINCQATGNYAMTGGGINNLASGLYSFAGGTGCTAAGQGSFAFGTSVTTGANNGVMIFSDSTPAVFTGIIADEFAFRARGGFRHAWDTTHYWTAKVDAAGIATFATLPVGAGFVFTPPITLSSLTPSTIIYSDAGRVIVSLVNAVGYLYNDGAGALSYVVAPLPGIHNVLDSAYHGDVLTGAITRGDILYGNATPKIARLALGGITGSVLTRNATDILWSAGALSFAGAFTLTIPATGIAALLGTANVFTAVQTINLNAVALPAPIAGTVVHIGQANATASRLMLDAFANAAQIFVRRAQNTAASPQALAINNTIGGFAGTGYGATGYATVPRVSINFLAAEAWTDAAQGTYIIFNTTPTGGVATAEKMRLTDVGNLKVGGTALRGTTEGTPHIDIFNGTDPVGTLTNGISIYSSAGECWIMDAAGNTTQQTPHDEKGEWIFYSRNTVTGKVLKIDMERMMRALNKKFGWDFVREYVELVQ